LDKGKMIEKGTHNELLEQKGMYYNLIQLQQLLSN
jgi:ABC-type multidrug transport system fused ATPase/permease subunit